MKHFSPLVLLLIIFSLSNGLFAVSSNNGNFVPYLTQDFTVQSVEFKAPNIKTYVINTGILDQNIAISNTPGFEWPINSGKFAIFTAGMNIAALVNGQLREATASYKGEYTPGYIIDSSGIPIPKTNSSFKIYKISAGDNYSNNPDWLNWGLMVPYGAPYTDVNHNNNYDPQIDSPGVRGAYQTLFVCLTDGFPETHLINEGFGGGTAPIFAEVHMTAWSYNRPGFNDIQFLKWDIFNKSNQPWNATQFSFVSDPDLGCADDDYIGCDTILKLAYCYNGDNNDDCSSYGNNYGLNPPAVGFLLLENAINKSVTPNKDLKMSSFTTFTNTSAPVPPCETDPNGEQAGAYNMMRGLKKDLTPWVIPPGGASNVTKYCYHGNPVTGTGWTEGPPGTVTGSVQNCGGPNIYTGTIVPVNAPGDRRIVMSSGAENFTVAPGEKQTITIAQFMVRGNSNFNSVALLKEKAIDITSGYLIGIEKTGEKIPDSYLLNQNYPNPFNPVTKISYELRTAGNVKLMVYDITGKEISVLVNEKQTAGTYEVTFDASNLPSGVYFYKLSAGEYNQTRKMVLIK